MMWNQETLRNWSKVKSFRTEQTPTRHNSEDLHTDKMCGHTGLYLSVCVIMSRLRRWKEKWWKEQKQQWELNQNGLVWVMWRSWGHRELKRWRTPPPEGSSSIQPLCWSGGLQIVLLKQIMHWSKKGKNPSCSQCKVQLQRSKCPLEEPVAVNPFLLWCKSK